MLMHVTSGQSLWPLGIDHQAFSAGCPVPSQLPLCIDICPTHPADPFLARPWFRPCLLTAPSHLLVHSPHRSCVPSLLWEFTVWEIISEEEMEMRSEAE